MDPAQSSLILTETYDMVPDPATGSLSLVLVSSAVEMIPKAAPDPRRVRPRAPTPPAPPS